MNERTGQAVADVIEVATTRNTRRRGLLGRDRLDAGAALMLMPCAAIHTAFMRFAIDVVFMDGEGRAVRTASCVRPWRVAAAFRARAVVELPAGHLDTRRVEVGDRLYLAPAVA